MFVCTQFTCIRCIWLYLCLQLFDCICVFAVIWLYLRVSVRRSLALGVFDCILYTCVRSSLALCVFDLCVRSSFALGVFDCMCDGIRLACIRNVHSISM